MEGRLLLSFAALIAVLIVSVLLAACGDDSEAGTDFTNPDIRGQITTLDAGTGDPPGSALIEGEVKADTGYDKASVRIDEETEIYQISDGEAVEASFEDLAEGQTVESWFEGPVAESYPVQAYAGRIVILE